MLDVLGIFADAVWAGRWLMVGAVSFGVLVVVGLSVFEAFVDGCREKPQRARLLAALIVSWLTR